jgi:hypothetical protein
VCIDVLYGDVLSRRRFVEETFCMYVRRLFTPSYCMPVPHHSLNFMYTWFYEELNK